MNAFGFGLTLIIIWIHHEVIFTHFALLLLVIIATKKTIGNWTSWIVTITNTVFHQESVKTIFTISIHVFFSASLFGRNFFTLSINHIIGKVTFQTGIKTVVSYTIWNFGLNLHTCSWIVNKWICTIKTSISSTTHASGIWNWTRTPNDIRVN